VIGSPTAQPKCRVPNKTARSESGAHRKQHDGSYSLNRKLESTDQPSDVIIDPEQKNQRPREEDGQEGPQRRR